jgi:hypothetical protein
MQGKHCNDSNRHFSGRPAAPTSTAEVKQLPDSAADNGVTCGGPAMENENVCTSTMRKGRLLPGSNAPVVGPAVALLSVLLLVAFA